MSLITNQITTAYNYTEMNQLNIPRGAIQTLSSFFSNKKFSFGFDAPRFNSLKIEDSKGSPISDVPETAILHVLSFLEDPKDFSSFIQTNKYFFSIAHKMPEDALSSDSMRFFLYAHDLFKEKNYSSISQELVRYVDERPLNAEDNFVCFPHFTEKRKKAAEMAASKAIQVEQQFYFVFKNRCIELCSPEQTAKFAIFRACAFNGLKKIVLSQVCCLKRIVMSFKLNTIYNHLNRSIYDGKIETYANQDAQAISGANFVGATQEFNLLFPEILICDVERDLRNALRIKHFKAFDELADRFSNLSAADPEIAKIKTQIVSQLPEQDSAYERMRKAQFAKDQAAHDLSETLKVRHGFFNPLHLLSAFESEHPDVPEARKKFLDACGVYCDAQKQYNGLVAILDELIEKRTHLIEKTKQKAAFYRELQQEVTENNKVMRHNALHVLI